MPSKIYRDLVSQHSRGSGQSK